MKTILPNKVLQQAIEVVSDYPLYGSTDGLTEKQIILIANVLIQGDDNV